MRNLKATAPKGNGSHVPVHRSTPNGEVVRGFGQRTDGKKESGVTREAARGLGISKK